MMNNISLKFVTLCLMSFVSFIGCAATDDNTVVIGYGCLKCNNILEGDLIEGDSLCKASSEMLVNLTNAVCAEKSECYGRCKDNLCNGLKIESACEQCAIKTSSTQFYICQNDDYNE